MRIFQIDAAQMIPAGWQPIGQQYIPGAPSMAGVALFGLLAFASKPPGSLMVTYQYQRPPAPPAAIDPPRCLCRAGEAARVGVVGTIARGLLLGVVVLVAARPNGEDRSPAGPSIP